jgi:hypothetical protein
MEFKRMMMNRDNASISRYQINQYVKAALVRHFADLSVLNFSTTGSTVYLSGSIRKDPKGEFPKVGLEALLREIVRSPGVRSLQANVDNWVINYTGAGFELYRKVIQRGGSGAGETVHIGESEYVQEVLEDIAGKDGEDNDRSR